MVSAQMLSDEAFLAQFDLSSVTASIEQGNLMGAQTALLDHYKSRVKPAWPALPNVLRDLDINTDELNQEQLIALADPIVDHRFISNIGAPKVTLDGKIVWHFSPIADMEWLWDLNRHEWWVVLGLAYVRTGDERYAATFVDIMLDWVKENPPPIHKDERSPSWRLMEVGLRMRFSWIPCFAVFQNSPAFTDQARLTMLRAIYDHARFLLLFTTTRNHLVRESNGLAYVGTYFPEFKEASLWRQVALTRLDQALFEQINQDGSHIEVSTGYQSLIIEEFDDLRALLQANNLALPKENLVMRLEKMYHVMAYLIRPDGTFPQVNDGILYWDYRQLIRAGEQFGRDDLIYIGTSGTRGICPTDTSIGFHDAGLYIMRSDWGADARYLLFDAGPFGGPHGHEDSLSIEVFAFGQAFIVDSGTYNYNRADPARAYFVASLGHNTVLVDGQSQVRRWRAENLTPKAAAGNYATWISQPEFDYVTASYTEGYSDFSFEKPNVPTIVKDVIHIRQVLFVKPDYWLIIDELRSSAPHTYQALFHTAPEIVVRAGPGNRAVLSTTSQPAMLHIIPAEPQAVKLTRSVGSEAPIPGWYSAGWGQKTPATVITYERQSQASTFMVTLLYPCREGGICDDVGITILPISEGKGLAFAVTSHYGTDYLMLSPDNSLKQFGPYRSRGLVAGIRVDKAGHALTSFEWQAGH
jgi:hypothetical protein